MGRRTTSTTKGGRYMNPADQERKQARKKELKKNKKQRHIVRQAVLKSKDPSDLLVQMEKLDEMEFTDAGDHNLSERVIQEKRTKLRETFTRVLGMYKRENESEKFADLRKQLAVYDQKRLQLEQQHIAQKFAREVDPAEIPLPDTAPPPPEAAAAMTPAAAIPRGIPAHLQPALPQLMIPEFAAQYAASGYEFLRQAGIAGKPGLGVEPLHGILKKSRKRSTVPPGPPIGVPPELSDSSDEEDYRRSHRHGRSDRGEQRYGSRDDDLPSDEEHEDVGEASHEDQEYDDDEDNYDEDGNLVSSKSSRVRFDDADADDNEEKDSRTKYKEMAKKIERGEIPSQAMGRGNEGIGMPPSAGACIPPPPSLTMIPPGGPRLMRPPIQLPGLGSLGPGMRMPPPPPPGMPLSRMQRPPAFVGHVSGATNAVAAVLSAPPSINKPKLVNPAAIIEAKPQLRNMQQEVTKLVPTALKIRRDQHAPAAQAQKKPKGPLVFRTPEAKLSVPGSSVQHAPQKSSDEAYDEFMKELNSLL